jgi:hypothetical protein
MLGGPESGTGRTRPSVATRTSWFTKDRLRVSENRRQSPDRPNVDGRIKGPVSRLAVAGLIIAAIPLCPLTSLLGALLGIFALRGIRLSGGRLSGQGFALAAVVIGLTFAFIWMAVLDHFAQQQREIQEAMMVDAVAAVMRVPENNDPARALQAWSTAAPDRPSGEEIARFAAEAADRYGRFDRFASMSISRSGSILRPVVEMAGVFHFADETLFGSASFETVVSPGRLTPVFRLTGLLIEDRGRGDLTLGGTKGKPSPAGRP